MEQREEKRRLRYKAHRRVHAHTPAGENAGQLANITG